MLDCVCIDNVVVHEMSCFITACVNSVSIILYVYVCTLCTEKKRSKCFCNISYRTLVILMKFGKVK